MSGKDRIKYLSLDFISMVEDIVEPKSGVGDFVGDREAITQSEPEPVEELREV